MQKILITGSNGFIGQYFIQKYQNKYSFQTFSFLRDKLEQLELNNINTIFYLSALVHQMSGASDREYERVNVTQTLQLAKKAKESGVKQFVFMSTIKVYGEESDVVYTEESVCTPQDEYGKSKLKAEKLLLEMEDTTFKVTIVRTPIVYGYGVKANIRNLINLINKTPVLPFGSIKNRRSMVYIGNLCHLVDTVIQQKCSGVYLASDNEVISTTQLVQYIANALGKRIYLIKVPFFESLLKFFKPSFYKRLYGSLEVNNERTKQKLFLENLYTLEEGISFTIKGENI
ncbi:NAD-dependent epimerase/dehydratase family protein [Sulfurimonas sp.]|uniref:NAD-dependent epimerase/dehydratase family protein n=1 Tax=Sulfurimonas sp. TaxID=2022749 RepID=UPI003D0F29F4